MYNPEKLFKEKILEVIKETWETPFVSVKEGVIKRKFNYLEIDHTDGIGTKGYYHWKQQTWRNAVVDSLAMNLNDLAVKRARAYKLNNHIMILEEDERLMQIIKALTEECKKRNIAIAGGECAFHNDSVGLEISTTITRIIQNHTKYQKVKSDLLIGIQSNGLHSNGFTKIREIFGKTIKAEFTEPTFIYADAILKVDQKFSIKHMIHITGGAFTRLKNIFPNQDVFLTRNHKLVPQKIFKEIVKKGVKEKEMYQTFNCGIGFILIVDKKDAIPIVKAIEKQGFQADVMGHFIPGTGKVIIESMFSERTIEL